MEEKASSFRASEIEAKELKKIMNELGEAIVHSVHENSNIVITRPVEIESKEEIDFQLRGQWLRAAVLGANDGLVTTASLMMGVGAVKKDSKTMAMPGLAALVAGACGMAIGEYVSVQTQRDAEETNLKREKRARAALGGFELGTDTPSSSNMTPPVSLVVLMKQEKKGGFQTLFWRLLHRPWHLLLEPLFLWSLRLLSRPMLLGFLFSRLFRPLFLFCLVQLEIILGGLLY
ncbi:vacuolar iron transporter homolog 3-like [Cryptomeria japonica]|uniref:vacuolar iron transporter homolog 3-like n=1 Tax=Cryptomeria japonica TaxID=3369 RepID=UPI0027DA7436|nr:vacuolar iron transporter homolog 3-like [Cryptomeria japonica]